MYLIRHIFDLRALCLQFHQKWSENRLQWKWSFYKASTFSNLWLKHTAEFCCFISHVKQVTQPTWLNSCHLSIMTIITCTLMFSVLTCAIFSILNCKEPLNSVPNLAWIRSLMDPLILKFVAQVSMILVKEQHVAYVFEHLATINFNQRISWLLKK